MVIPKKEPLPKRLSDCFSFPSRENEISWGISASSMDFERDSVLASVRTAGAQGCEMAIFSFSEPPDFAKRLPSLDSA